MTFSASNFHLIVGIAETTDLKFLFSKKLDLLFLLPGLKFFQPLEEESGLVEALLNVGLVVLERRTFVLNFHFVTFFFQRV